VRHSGTHLGLSLILAAALCALGAQPAMAQKRAAIKAQRQAAAQQRRENQVPKAPKGQPNARGLEGLPPKWVDNMRDMPPEQQERFMQNNERFQSLPPERQAQIRNNLQKWNSLSPDQREAIRGRERALEQMSPEQRQYVQNTLLPKWQSMPQDRRQAVNRHLAALRNMTPAEQQAALNNPRFMQGLSPDEQSMVRDLNSLGNPPSQ